VIREAIREALSYRQVVVPVALSFDVALPPYFSATPTTSHTIRLGLGKALHPPNRFLTVGCSYIYIFISIFLKLCKKNKR
jgi:hypothetical protein